MASPSDMSKVAGPASMAPPRRNGNSSYAAAAAAAGSSSQSQYRSQPGTNGAESGHNPGLDGGSKKKRHRAGKKRRNRRQSFIAPSEATETELDVDQRSSHVDSNRPAPGQTQASFYRLKSAARSNTSLESEALLDHREQNPIRTRRQSIQQSMFGSRSGVPYNHRPGTQRPSHNSMQPSSPIRSRAIRSHNMSDSDDEDEVAVTDRTPLISRHGDRDRERDRPPTSRTQSSHVAYGSSYHRRASPVSMVSSRKAAHRHPGSDEEDFDVNNPPSVPGSPKLGTLDDVMIAEQFSDGRSPANRESKRDAVIDIDRDTASEPFGSASPSSLQTGDARRRTVHNLAENDVCYPGDVDMSVIGEEDLQRPDDGSRSRGRRRRGRRWPDLDVLEEWRLEEEEEQQEKMVRAKKISEPMLVGGRLRPTKTQWHRQEDDAPYRYTYFNETFDGTIHSRTIGELTQFGTSFRELFIPDPAELSDESETEDEKEDPIPHAPSIIESGRQSRQENNHDHASKARETSGSQTPAQSQTQKPTKGKRLGPRPTFWLDVLSPTEQEMKVLAKAFGIHQLTTEDILMQEPREKVELFQNYYFVNYRSFEQDKDSEDYMEPVNMYVVVFREGVISFHFSMTPHPANVRRRIRQLNDYMSPTADWMSYAIIDDITDVYAPLVQQIEDEVDDIDSSILALHSPMENSDKEHKKSAKAKELEYEKLNKSASDTRSEKGGEATAGDNGGDMLRRVGEGRKKVMTLYRLLGNKADVIKGFAKRCNEHWEVAPRSEIGLYLGDIQDHIVTMTGNLSHYENLLSRAHSNYLAQINIRMNERAEQTNDVLGKLTVLGTIVLPMNIVTGIFGCNFLVPGQDVPNLNWFWSVCGSLLGFGLLCYFIARRVYGIV